MIHREPNNECLVFIIDDFSHGVHTAVMKTLSIYICMKYSVHLFASGTFAAAIY